MYNFDDVMSIASSEYSSYKGDLFLFLFCFLVGVMHNLCMYNTTFSCHLMEVFHLHF
jgi:hypothetical protein